MRLPQKGTKMHKKREFRTVLECSSAYRSYLSFCAFSCLFVAIPSSFGSTAQKSLAVGFAAHAFDHLGNIGDQAEAAAASGANIIYASGLGALGYQGLPREPEFLKQRQSVSAYIGKARKSGIQLVIGYVCATSMVKLSTFDRNWPEPLRKQFHSPPADG